jgi:hypothetical protein
LSFLKTLDKSPTLKGDKTYNIWTGGKNFNRYAVVGRWKGVGLCVAWCVVSLASGIPFFNDLWCVLSSFGPSWLTKNFMLMLQGRGLQNVRSFLECNSLSDTFQYISDFPTLTDVQMALFAEDSALFSTHAKADVIIDRLQSA